MRSEDDTLYYRRRAAQERDRALSPADPSTMIAHRKLAAEYERWLNQARVQS